MSLTFSQANALLAVTAALPLDWRNDPCTAQNWRLVATPKPGESGQFSKFCQFSARTAGGVC
jgi:hypothetical protein